ncbi:hypothetical protein DTO021C3_2955 [Paecilomyces variotii]|nr:hypothetical protein DTO195F2_3206 [Paecilomyces variotii]KAJ9289504.1 hypothetical protein DTO021C3_2955 [Paecilomyces variotii]KAJ9388862.1 hypothetical protein DTO063F5_2510 [Paecilomyces variotii]
MIFSDRMVLEMNVFPDRKFPLRWVLFSEGDEEGMSMTGYISLSNRDLHGHSVVILRKGFTSLTPYIISQRADLGYCSVPEPRPGRFNHSSCEHVVLSIPAAIVILLREDEECGQRGCLTIRQDLR